MEYSLLSPCPQTSTQTPTHRHTCWLVCILYIKDVYYIFTWPVCSNCQVRQIQFGPWDPDMLKRFSVTTAMRRREVTCKVL